MKLVRHTLMLALFQSLSVHAAPILTTSVPGATGITVHPDHRNPHLYYVRPSGIQMAVLDDGTPLFRFMKVTEGVESHGIVEITLEPVYRPADTRNALSQIQWRNPNARFALLPVKTASIRPRAAPQAWIKSTDCSAETGSFLGRHRCTIVLTPEGTQTLEHQLYRASGPLVVDFDYVISGVAETDGRRFEPRDNPNRLSGNIGSPILASHPELFVDAFNRPLFSRAMRRFARTLGTQEDRCAFSPLFLGPPECQYDLNKVGVSQLVAGTLSTCALTTDGRVYCWGGWNNGVERALSHENNGKPLRWEPRKLELPPIHSIALGGNNGCAISHEGDLYCWGNNEQGQVGNGLNARQITPVRVDVPPMQSVSVGLSHVCAVSMSRQVFCWGNNHEGEIGVPNLGASDRLVLYPRLLPLTHINHVSVGKEVSCAVAGSGELYCWGNREILSETFGDLGNARSILPTRMTLSGAALPPVLSVQIFGRGLCIQFVKTGQRCNVEPGDKTHFTLGKWRYPWLDDLSYARSQVFVGTGYRCKLDFATDLMTCRGELYPTDYEDGTHPYSFSAPRQLPMPSIATAAIGHSHVCILTFQNKIHCTGFNGKGQLGVRTTDPTSHYLHGRFEPVEIAERQDSL